MYSTPSESLVYSYNNLGSRFAARLTVNEAEKLQSMILLIYIYNINLEFNKIVKNLTTLKTIEKSDYNVLRAFYNL